MLEQEPHNTPEDTNHQTEELVDVMSLKKVEMTTDEYKYYGDLYPDDPQLTEWLQRNGVVPGESIIVSATDAEHPENNLSLVIATGEDSFTTNRALTNELEARLLETDSSAERIVPEDIRKELGEHTLSAVDVEAPKIENTVSETAEQTLLDAKNNFNQRLDQLSTQYIEVAGRYKNELKKSAEELNGMRGRINASAESALGYLRTGLNQPERIRRVVTSAIEELSRANSMLGRAVEGVESGRTMNANLNTQAENYKSDIGRLHGEFHTNVSQVVDDAPELERAIIGRADGEVTEMTVQQKVVADHLVQSALEINVALRQVDDDVDDARRRVSSLLGRLDSIQTSSNRGRFDSSEYEGVVRSAAKLVDELQTSKTIRRFVAMAGEL